MPFTRNDKDLYNILQQATKDEKLLLSKIIADKFSSDIGENCTDPYKIAKELQLMGGNSIANGVRSIVNGLSSQGVSYKELATEAAEKVGASISISDNIDIIERKLLATLIKKATEQMSEEDVQAFYREVEKKGVDKAYNWKDALQQGAILTPAIYAILAEISMPYILRTLGLRSAVAFASGRAASAAIPVVGWGLALGSILNLIAGTAYKVTIPCTAYVGAIRARLKDEEEARKRGHLKRKLVNLVDQNWQGLREVNQPLLEKSI